MIELTIISKPKKLQDRCMLKISDDGGKTWWPRGPLEIRVAGDISKALNEAYAAYDAEKRADRT